MAWWGGLRWGDVTRYVTGAADFVLSSNDDVDDDVDVDHDVNDVLVNSCM